MRSTIGIVLLALSSGACAMTGDLGHVVPPTVDQDPALPHLAIEVAGRTRKVHIHTFGSPDRPVLLFLHGSLADHRAFLPFDVLSDRYFVVMWDQRGNGLSERIEDAEYTEDSIVEEIEAVRVHFAAERPVTLVGHSFGGMYAALYMTRYPDKVSQAVFLEPGGLNGQIFTETFAEIININIFAFGLNSQLWRTEFVSPSDHEAADQKALMMLLDTSQTNYFCDRDHVTRIPVWRPGALVDVLRAEVLGAEGTTFHFDFSGGLETFPRPVLFVASTCSALGASFQRKHHLPLFRDARLVEINNSGHRLFVEDFPAVLEAMNGYLAPDGM